MSTIYNDLDNDFTLIPNVILQDTRVSGLAFKMYSYIAFRLGRDKKWEFYNREIISHFKEGRDAVMKARNELLELGYLEVKKQNKAFNGKYLGNDYIIRKNPKKPITENQYTENPLTENQCSNNKDRKNKDLNKKDCNAVQSNFSQNEEEVLEIPSASSRNISATIENSSSSEIPNNSPIAKNATTENYEPLSITVEEYITEWKKINDKAEPQIGFEKSHENFKRCCNIKVQKEYGGWKKYLAKWIAEEKHLKYLDNSETGDRKKGKKPEISEPYEDEPPALIETSQALNEKFIKTSQALNEKFHEALKGEIDDLFYNFWFKTLSIVGLRGREAIVLVQTKEIRTHLCEFYPNRLKTIIKKVCEKHFKEDGFKLSDYKLVLEEELTKTTTII